MLTYRRNLREGITTRGISSFRFHRLDALTKGGEQEGFARWMNRLLLAGLVLFTIFLPHSIAAAQIGLSLSYLAWVARAIPQGSLGVKRTPLDRPLLCFAALTLLSSLFSIEPGESLPKLRSLTLFLLFYLVVANLRPRGAQVLVGLLVISGLVGVGYSLWEKSWGRGVTIQSIDASSPLQGSALQPGDVIWMIGRQRIHSIADTARAIQRAPSGTTLNIEALHNGDPIPVKLTVTDGLKEWANPLGVKVGGASRRFRVSGFSRHFITYAEQMQLLALLAYGLLLARWKIASAGRVAWLYLVLASLFSLTLILTASRSVIASWVVAVLVVGVLTRAKRATFVTLAAVIVIGLLASYVLVTTRSLGAVSLSDDSSERRVGYMLAGLRLIPQHPLLGVGMDAQKRHWREWGFPGEYVTHTHSTPIQIALDRGLPALGCYLWLLCALFLLVWRSYQRAFAARTATGAGLALGAVAALLGFSASSLINYNFGDSEVLLLLLFIIALALAQQEQQEQAAPT